MIVGRLDIRASSTAQFTDTVVVPAPPLAPRNTWRDARLARAGVGRLASGRGLADRAVEGLFHRARRLRLPARRPGKELVRAGAHRAEDQVRFRGQRDREDRHRRVRRAQPFDRRHARSRVRPQVDDRDVGMRPVRGRAAVDDADGDPARPQQRGRLAFEFVIVADDERCELCHVDYVVVRVGPSESGRAERQRPR